MAKPSLQLKSVASLLLTTAAGIASGVAAERGFATPQKPGWQFPAAVLVLCVLLQLALVFVASAEEVELSSFRDQAKRLADLEHERQTQLRQQQIDSNKAIAVEKMKAIKVGDLEKVTTLEELRRKLNG